MVLSRAVSAYPVLIVCAALSGCAGSSACGPPTVAPTMNGEQQQPRKRTKQSMNEDLARKARFASAETQGAIPHVTLPSPFLVVDTLGEVLDSYSLFPAGSTAFLGNSRVIERQLLGDQVKRVPDLMGGLPQNEEWFSIRDASGRWPDSFWLASVEYHKSEMNGGTRLWRWNGQVWAKQAGLLCGEGYFEGPAQPWTNGRYVKLESCLGGVTSRFRVLAGPPDPETDAILSDATRVTVDEFLGFPSGQLFAAGVKSETFFELPVVERFGAGTSSLDLLPGPIVAGTKWSVAALAGASPTDVHVAYDEIPQAGGAERAEPPQHFAHFDGATWQNIPLPIPGGIQKLWAQPDGVLFALGRSKSLSEATDSLWTRNTRGQWSEVELPDEVVADSVSVNVSWFWPNVQGDAWAFVEVSRTHERKNYLLHTRPTVWQGAPTPVPSAMP